MSTRIEDYALIGDCKSAALVARNGSIDWLCWPRFDSEACFAALLGTRDHGRWLVAPQEQARVTRRYRPNTLILETHFETADGAATLVDFMPFRVEHSEIVRLVVGTRGKLKMHTELILRFGYGAVVPWVTRLENGALRAIAGPDMAVLRTPVRIKGKDMTSIGEFVIGEGETIPFVLTYARSHKTLPESLDPTSALQATEKFWTEWAAKCRPAGEWSEAVRRSVITLKALTYEPTGGIVAAPTTSLPERLGGERNWDYRYCWLRDTSFTLLVLMRAGYTEEAVQWRLWLLRAIAGSPGQVQSIYGISGERQLIEWNADWLRGYEDSLPVRFGNGAAKQFQLDVFGEVATALYHTPDADEDIRVPASKLQASLIDHLCQVWPEPDEGIWETRGGRQHFVHSKVMAWVALDRALKNYERFDGGGDVKRWRKNRDMLHKEICAKGFNKKLNAFTQSYGSKELDASCLRLGLVGFLPMDDPRIIGTVDAIQKNLTKNGLVLRYIPAATPDGLKGDEGTFLACSFWLVVNLHLMGRKEEASEMFHRLLALRNDVGLLSEEYDPVNKRMLGNFPQALSHIALIHAAFTLSGHWQPQPFVAAK